MKTNNPPRQGLVQVSKVPEVISSFLKDVLSGYDKIQCNQQRTETGTSFTFHVENKLITFSIKEGGQA